MRGAQTKSCWASLPMYDLPEVREHVDRLWARVRDAMRGAGLDDVPEELTHVEGEFDAHWISQRLFFSQICGIEILKRFQGRYRVLATPRFSAPGCVGHHYRSFVVVRDDARYQQVEDLRGGRLAVNSYYSHSGATAVLPIVAPLSEAGSFFSRVLVSGAHAESIAMITRGEAEVATVDCVTYALLERYRPEALAAIRVLAKTPAAPGPPYVAPTSYGDDVIDRMRAALKEAFADPLIRETREALLLEGIESTDDEAYLPIFEFLESGERHGYTQLREAYRIPVRIPITIRLPSASFVGQTRNLSTHGAFIAVDELPAFGCVLDAGLPPVGAEIALALEIEEERLELHAVVVWHDVGDETPGIGIRFIDVSEETQERIERYLRRSVRPTRE
jgi:hypothetical protein